MIYLALSKTIEESGWGVATKHLKHELSKKTKIVDLWDAPSLNKTVDGKVLHCIGDIWFNPTVQTKGTYNAGYCFFELDLTQESVRNAAKYDHIFCGSTCNVEELAKHGIDHTSLLIQGVDRNSFAPINRDKGKAWQDKFVIFSGGKLEYRKGQDVVMAAFKKLQQKYKDLALVTAWENAWPNSVMTMNNSKLIDFTMHGDDWVDAMHVLFARNRILPNRCFHYGFLKQPDMYRVMANTDIGIFPNRCEGGTNLALMEYMSTGKPVIASYNSGHKDVLTEENAILLTDMKAETIKPYQGVDMTATWWEPSVDELIAKIEWAHDHMDELRGYGQRASMSMRQYSWEKAAINILDVLNGDGCGNSSRN